VPLGRVHYSKIVTQSQLDDPRWIRAHDLSEAWASYCILWIAEIHLVEQIEKVSSQLKASHVFSQQKFLM